MVARILKKRRQGYCLERDEARKRAKCLSCGATTASLWYCLNATFYFCTSCVHGQYRTQKCYGGVYPMIPTWPIFMDNTESVDNTGSAISIVANRPDAMALAAYAHMSSKWALSDSVFLFAFCLAFYWSWPIHFFATICLAAKPGKLTPIFLRSALSRTRKHCQSIKVKSGNYFHKGLSAIKNPSERTSGVKRYLQLISDGRKWHYTAIALADFLFKAKKGRKPVELQPMLNILGACGMRAYTGKVNYGNLRMLRLLVHSYGLKLADSERDYWLLYRCSAHVKKTYNRVGIGEFYAVAIHFRNALRVKLKDPAYSLSDLTCYVCLLDKDAFC